MFSVSPWPPRVSDETKTRFGSRRRRAEWEELGIATRPRVLEAWRERDLGAARARLGEPRATAALEEGRAMAWEQAVELALGKKPD